MGTAWYTREFSIPKDWSDKLALVAFEGVNYKAKAWINGVLLGEHEGGFTPFAFRAEKILKYGDCNRHHHQNDDPTFCHQRPPDCCSSFSSELAVAPGM